MHYRSLSLALIVASFVGRAGADTPPKAEKSKPAAVSSLEVDALLGFADMPDEVRALITEALALTKQNLTYTFGSSDPKRGGMDCSGAIYRLLQDRRLLDCPRQSDEICLWVKGKSKLHLTPTATTLNDAEFAKLQPGDLMFWTGTYAASDRKLPISHVMLYLGKRKSDGKPVVFGASDGRRYAGQSRCGVSVFDLELPKPGSKATFYGYGAVPGLTTKEIRKPLVPAVPKTKG